MTTKLRRLSLLLPIVVLSAAAHAHVLDEYLQATIVVIAPDAIRLQMNLTPGTEIANQVIAIIDANHDATITPQEAAAYADLLKNDLQPRLDDRPLTLALTASSFPSPSDLRTGQGIIRIEFTVASGPLTPGTHHFTLENHHQPATAEYLFNAATPASTDIQITRQARNKNQSLGEIDFTFTPASPPHATAAIAAATAASLAFITGSTWLYRRSRRQPAQQ